MAHTPDMTSCRDASTALDGALSPFYMLNYHFGMLLGVDDFATEQAHHRGKMRLHNGWLHGEGVVWGFDVVLDIPRGEVRVRPGLALDASGHELHLEADACLNVGEWFKVHQREPEMEILVEGDRSTFEARVEIRYKSCLTRQVPALLEPCDGSGGGGTAYSRIFETVDIRLQPGNHGTGGPPRPYHRLRVLLSIEDPVLPADQPVVDLRDTILTLPCERQPAAYAEALRRLAALDEIDLGPPKNPDGTTMTLFAADDSPPVLLADIVGTVVKESGEGEEERWRLVEGEVEVTVRPSHIATSTIQELLCGPLVRCGMDTERPAGPRVLAETAVVRDSEIEFEVDADLAAASVRPEAFHVTAFDETTGWTTAEISGVEVKGRVVIVSLEHPLPSPVHVRFLARGRGDSPILGANLIPLAGAAGGPNPPPHDGNDFVLMHQRS